MSQRVLAKYLDLSPATISLVVNNAPGAMSISPATRERVMEAVRKLDYHPNSIARSLRTRQTFTIGVIVTQLSESYCTTLMNGVEEYLMQAGYLTFVVCHRGRPSLIHEYPKLLMNRSVDGLLLVNTPLNESVRQPVVSISAHKGPPGVTNVLLDHNRAATLALKHLYELGHRRIALIRANRDPPGSETRWQSLTGTASQLGFQVVAEQDVCMEANSWSPEVAYSAVRDLLNRTRDFTAIFCLNDATAISVIGALVDVGLSCPGDVSVVGLDDIASAMYQRPSLTTVQQPWYYIGTTASQMLLRRIQSPHEAHPETMTFEPKLMVGGSTAAPRPLPELQARAVPRQKCASGVRKTQAIVVRGSWDQPGAPPGSKQFGGPQFSGVELRLDSRRTVHKEATQDERPSGRQSCAG
jgi:LacI family transcriptional regulator